MYTELKIFVIWCILYQFGPFLLPRSQIIPKLNDFQLIFKVFINFRPAQVGVGDRGIEWVDVSAGRG